MKTVVLGILQVKGQHGEDEVALPSWSELVLMVPPPQNNGALPVMKDMKRTEGGGHFPPTELSQREGGMDHS